jgi:hypothetical protein
MCCSFVAGVSADDPVESLGGLGAARRVRSCGSSVHGWVSSYLLLGAVLDLFVLMLLPGCLSC